MEVHFNSHLEARLTQRAAQQGRKPDEFVQDVVARYLDEEERFAEAVKRGEDGLERGEFTSPYGAVRPPRKWRGKPAATKARHREMTAGDGQKITDRGDPA